MTNDSSEPAPTNKPSLLGGLFRSWIFIYVVPAVVIFGIRQYSIQQAEAERQREQEQQILNTLQNVDPATMDPALRMLLGIDEGQPADQRGIASAGATEDGEVGGEPADGPEVTQVTLLL
jgi:hypothetical protein